jgi:hypothetical protein
MPVIKCDPDFEVMFESADARAVPGTRIDDDDRRLALIGTGFLVCRFGSRIRKRT